MKISFSAAVAAVVVAVASGASSRPVMAPTRDEEHDNVVLPLSEWSFRMKQCQHTVAAGKNEHQFIVTNSNVTYELCSGDFITMYNSETGKYPIECGNGDQKLLSKTATMDTESYLRAATDHYKDRNEKKCIACDDYCPKIERITDTKKMEWIRYPSNPDRSLYTLYRYYSSHKNEPTVKLEDLCDTCRRECNIHSALEHSGTLNHQVDASLFVGCKPMLQRYIGPVCTNGGSNIEMGVFYDDKCTVLETSMDEIRKMTSKLSYLNFGVATGRYDAFEATSAFGGTIHMSCRAPPEVRFSLTKESEWDSYHSDMCKKFDYFANANSSPAYNQESVERLEKSSGKDEKGGH